MWDELLTYVHRRHDVCSHGPDFAMFDMLTDQRASHLVSVRRTAMKGSQHREWVVVQSPICETGSADPLRAAARAQLYMAGGVVADEEFMSLRNALTLPLVDLHGLDATIDAVGSCAYKIGVWLLG